MRIIFSFVLFLIFPFQSFIYAHVGLNYPKGGETFNPGDKINIDWYIVIDHGDCTWDLYYSIDEGNNWEAIATGLPKSQLNYSWIIPNNLANTSCKIKVVQNNVLSVPYSEMSGDFKINSTTTGITKEKTQVYNFILYPAYPNPFNPSTNIKYIISEQSRVKINVYNIVGKKVTELTNNILQAGIYNLKWNATNLSSGPYFLTVEAVSIQSQNKFTKTIKMILMK